MAYIPVYDTPSDIYDFTNEPKFRVLTVRDRASNETDVTFNSTPRNDYRVAYFVDSSQTKDTGFQYFIDTKYNSLSQALQNPKLVIRYYLIGISDFKSVLDGRILIYDSGTYFIINKIFNFIPERVTKVELLKVF
jgi:hypothetical protein